MSQEGFGKREGVSSRGDAPFLYGGCQRMRPEVSASGGFPYMAQGCFERFPFSYLTNSLYRYIL